MWHINIIFLLSPNYTSACCAFCLHSVFMHWHLSTSWSVFILYDINFNSVYIGDMWYYMWIWNVVVSAVHSAVYVDMWESKESLTTVRGNETAWMLQCWCVGCAVDELRETKSTDQPDTGKSLRRSARFFSISLEGWFILDSVHQKLCIVTKISFLFGI